MSITNYLNDILNGNLNKVKSYDNSLINEIGRINPKGYDLIPLFVAIGLYLENQEKGKEMIDYLLSIPNVNVSKIVEYNGGFVNEINTVFHLISSVNISEEICNLFLNHSSFKKDTLNVINHDDYRPLDLADEYNPNISTLLQNNGAIRYWRVGPGFKNEVIGNPSSPSK